MSIPVTRVKRNKFVGDSTSPVLNYLVRVPGKPNTVTLKSLASEIQRHGSLTVGDIKHVMNDFVEELLKELVKGNKVKIDGLGTFYVTFSCEGAENEKDCTVRSIKRVNIRFKVDNTLRLANDSTATTRGAANNVEFYIKGEAAKPDAGGKPGNEPGGKPGNNPDDEGEEDFSDPNA
jgi:predicted histone-like DNA-binding protein